MDNTIEYMLNNTNNLQIKGEKVIQFYHKPLQNTGLNVTACLLFATRTHTFPLLAPHTIHKERAVGERPVVGRVGTDFLLRMTLPLQYTGSLRLDLAATERITVHDSCNTLCIVL